MTTVLLHSTDDAEGIPLLWHVVCPAAARKVGRSREQQSIQRWFGPREFKEGRVQVFGCSPGCLLISILGSVILTVLANLFLWAIF